MDNDRVFKRKVINLYGRNHKLLLDLLKKTKNTPRGSGLIFCPFHDNVNTPAAKYFDDPDGERIYCFSEGRGYDLSDYYYKVMGLNLDTLFQQVWNSLSENEKEEYIGFFGEYKGADEEPDDIEIYTRFKNKEITYKEMLIALINKT